MPEVLGMPLEAALEATRRAGEPAPRVVYTVAPKGAQADATWRVVRVRTEEWVVGAFPDGDPTRES